MNAQTSVARSPRGSWTTDWREIVGVLAGMTAVTLLMTWPVVRVSTIALPNDPGDPLLNAWILAWDADRIAHGLRGFWDLPAFFPYAHTLLYTEHLFGIAILVAPLNWATRNPILAYNAAFLLSFVVAGAGMYGLVQSLTNRRDAAWVAGLIYAFCPYRMAMLSHLQVLWSGWLPVALWALHRYFITGARRAVIAFAAAFLLLALSNGYFLFFSVVPILLVTAIEWARVRPRPLKLVSDAALAAAIIGATLAPVVIAYSEARREQGLVRAYEEVNSYRADLASYLHTSANVRLWRHLPGLATPEGDLFPGLTAMVLAAVACWRRREPPARVEDHPRSRAITTYALVGAIGFILSLGPEPTAWGHRLLTHAPYEWLMRLVPGFDGLRVPARFAVLAFLSLAVLAAFGVRRLLDALSATARWSVTAVLSSAILLEACALPLPTAPIPAMSIDDRGAYWWLRDNPPGGAVEFPLQRPMSHSPLVYQTREPAGYLNTMYQYRTLFHHHPIVNGFSGYEPLLNVQLRRLVQDHRLGDALTMLRSVGVAYVIVHPPASSTQPLAPVTAADVAAETAQIVDRVDFGKTTAFRLKEWQEATSESPPTNLRRVPPTSIDATASHMVDRLDLTFDDDLRTRWTMGPQTGREWIEVRFDRPRRIVRVEMDLGANFSDYPRRLVIDAINPGGSIVQLFDGDTIPLLARGLVRNPRVAPLEIALPPTLVSQLRIRQTGQSPAWNWSIHELTFWEP